MSALTHVPRCPHANTPWRVVDCDWCVPFRAGKAEGAREAREDIMWLLHFVDEPEWFPNEGDRLWWRERLQNIRARAARPEGGA